MFQNKLQLSNDISVLRDRLQAILLKDDFANVQDFILKELLSYFCIDNLLFLVHLKSKVEENTLTDDEILIIRGYVSTTNNSLDNWEKDFFISKDDYIKLNSELVNLYSFFPMEDGVAQRLKDLYKVDLFEHQTQNQIYQGFDKRCQEIADLLLEINPQEDIYKNICIEDLPKSEFSKYITI